MNLLNKIFSFIAGFFVVFTKFVNHTFVILKKNISHDNELRTRIYSGSIFGIIFLIIIIAGGIVYNTAMMICSVVMFQEWLNIIQPLKSEDQEKYKYWLISGVFYVVMPVSSIISIRSISYGANIILWYFMIIWTTDCGAYFIGKKFGGKKLAPSISPGKTLSGSIGALVSSGLISILLYPMISNSVLSKFGVNGCLFLALLISFVSQVSDLFESWIKRKFNVKDSSNFIPGHGGIMDRLDSLTFSAPLLLLVINRILDM